jgi:hypothetical protein
VTELLSRSQLASPCARDCCQETMRYNVVLDTPAFYVAPLTFAARSSAKFCPNHFQAAIEERAGPTSLALAAAAMAFLAQTARASTWNGAIRLWYSDCCVRQNDLKRPALGELDSGQNEGEFNSCQPQCLTTRLCWAP